MKYALLLLLAIAGGALLGTLVVKDPGYVLLAYGDFAWETSIWLAVFALLFLYVAVRLVVNLVVRSYRSQMKLRGWNRERRENSSRQQTQHGLLLLAEGDWQEGRRQLLAGAAESQTPLVNYLNAARAANELGEGAQRDELLDKAHQSTPGSGFAVELLRAELQIERGQHQLGLDGLVDLKQRAPKHPRVLRLQARCLERLERWAELTDLLAEMKAAASLPGDALQEVASRAWRQRLQAEPSEALWKVVPKEVRREPKVVAEYARALLGREQHAEAEALLRKTLKSQWDSSLALLYGEIDHDVAKQLSTAQGWQRSQGESAATLVTLGRLAFAQEDYAAAREHLEASLKIEALPQAYALLSRVCVMAGDSEAGSEYLMRATQ